MIKERSNTLIIKRSIIFLLNLIVLNRYGSEVLNHSGLWDRIIKKINNIFIESYNNKWLSGVEMS
jgi:hypothetical protein